MKWKAAYTTAGLIVVGLGASAGAGIWYAVQLREETMPHGPSTRVPRRFRDVREAPGHRAHLRQGLECGRCHTLLDGGMGRVDVQACLDCHQDQRISLHDEVMRESSPQCTSCHQFTDEEIVRTATCVNCHAEVAQVTNDAHAAACLGCHSPHGDAPVVATCEGCHSEPARWHPAAREDRVACLDCHQIHGHLGSAAGSPPGTPVHAMRGAGGAAGRCLDCHADEAHALVAPGSRGHDRCIDCHDPHSAGGSVARPCRSCHEERDHVAAAAHGDCTTCHAPHTPTAAPAERRCASCHEAIASDHPSVAGGTCTTCHEPHPDRGETVAAATTCGGCHDAPRPTAFHAGGLACVNCHTPHDFGGDAAARACATCHAEQATQVSHTQGHRECTGCHTGNAHHHPERSPRACASCHTTEHATAVAGHRECTSCHRPHDGDLGSHAQCSSCHQTEARTGHGAEVQCSSCHRPHGPGGTASPPQCTTCHSPRSLPSLHTVAAHRTCDTCHDAHEQRPSASRATCTGTCHTEMRDHQPAATQCSGCHPFH